MSIHVYPRPAEGAYCVDCRAFVQPDKLLPLKRRKKVAPHSQWEYGDDVGRCPWHQQRECSFVVASE